MRKIKVRIKGTIRIHRRKERANPMNNKPFREEVMKKFSVSVFSIILLICTMFVFTACDKKKEGLPDLADCEIGYKLPVYPTCKFDYKMDDGSIIHINKFDATLTSKRGITAGEPISGDFYKYDIEINLVGLADPSLSGKQIEARWILAVGIYCFAFTKIGEDGAFLACTTTGVNSLPETITFLYLRFL